MLISMRDPARIPEILRLIEEAWVGHPDQRLGQLLVNLLDPSPNRLFNVEDDVLQERLTQFLASGVWPTAKPPP
jgi:uncharacterized protein YihD (DUF1040 family)